MKKGHYQEPSARAGEATSHDLIGDATLETVSLTGKVTGSGATEALQSKTS